MSHLITGVQPGSPAHTAGAREGDRLRTVNGHPVKDLFDYQWLTASAGRTLTLGLLREGVPIALRARIRPDVPTGLSFERDMLGGVRKCANNCAFCFVDQLPSGLRDSLYVKDDDWRFSVLMGGYVTLTNVPEAAIDRICRMRISPLYVSVHATDPAVRARLLGTERGADVMPRLKRLAEAGVTVHAQAVLCPGVNDGDVLAQTLADLSGLHPRLKSLALVPVGLTAHREGLPALSRFNLDTAKPVLRIADAFQASMLSHTGSRFVYPADEFYLIADEPLPPLESYEDLPQIENGVGMLRLFEREFGEAVAETPPPRDPPRVAVVTGMSAKEYLQALLRRHGLTHAEVISAENRLFGPTVTVAGLVCGRDALHALQSAGIAYDRVLLPSSMLRERGDAFLDNMTLREFSHLAGARSEAVPVNGGSFAQALFAQTT